VFERGERDERGVRFREGVERLSQLLGDDDLLDVLDRDISSTTGVIGARERVDQRSIVSQAAGMITRKVGRGDQKPRQHGSIDDSYRLPPTPELEECAGRDVFRVVHIPSHPERVAIHAVPVAIEDRGETVAIAPKRSSPGRVLLRKQPH